MIEEFYVLFVGCSDKFQSVVNLILGYRFAAINVREDRRSFLLGDLERSDALGGDTLSVAVRGFLRPGPAYHHEETAGHYRVDDPHRSGKRLPLPGRSGSLNDARVNASRATSGEISPISKRIHPGLTGVRYISTEPL